VPKVTLRVLLAGRRAQPSDVRRHERTETHRLALLLHQSAACALRAIMRIRVRNSMHRMSYYHDCCTAVNCNAIAEKTRVGNETRARLSNVDVAAGASGSVDLGSPGCTEDINYASNRPVLLLNASTPY
jgi:hypothetical protein